MFLGAMFGLIGLLTCSGGVSHAGDISQMYKLLYSTSTAAIYKDRINSIIESLERRKGVIDKARAKSVYSAGPGSKPGAASAPGSDQENLTIEYTPPAPVLEPLSLPYPGPEGEGPQPFTTEISFVSIGRITGGIFNGGQLVRASMVDNGPCKGSGCGKPHFLRFALTKEDIVLLPKISEGGGISSGKELSNAFKNAVLSKFGLRFTAASYYSVPVLEYPKKLTGDATGQVLEYAGEEGGTPDQAKLVEVFTSPLFCKIYTTRPGLNPLRSFYYSVNTPETEPPPPDIGECSGSACFQTNGFFAFRPDGTFLKYSFSGVPAQREIKWSTKMLPGAHYYARTYSGCSGRKLDYNSVVPDEIVPQRDLEVIGADKNGKPVYGIKNNNNKVLTEFYENYKNAFPHWKEDSNQENDSLRTFNTFLSMRPVFLWRDPFNRMLRFNNREFIMPFFCEPVIYLYPKSETSVAVKLKSEVKITASTPEYCRNWEVIANPSGMLINRADGKTYPYLFWEGASYIFPMRREGFVVENSGVGAFLAATLPELGLNENETTDFLTAWLPRFSGAPYFFITFTDPKFIDYLAPLEVEPEPDTVIRILMDFKPLQEYTEVPKLSLPQPPVRFGFTVVEWGGMQR